MVGARRSYRLAHELITPNKRLEKTQAIQTAKQTSHDSTGHSVVTDSAMMAEDHWGSVLGGSVVLGGSFLGGSVLGFLV